MEEVKDETTQETGNQNQDTEEDVKEKEVFTQSDVDKRVTQAINTALKKYSEKHDMEIATLKKEKEDAVEKYKETMTDAEREKFESEKTQKEKDILIARQQKELEETRKDVFVKEFLVKDNIPSEILEHAKGIMDSDVTDLELLEKHATGLVEAIKNMRTSWTEDFRATQTGKPSGGSTNGAVTQNEMTIDELSKKVVELKRAGKDEEAKKLAETAKFKM